MTSAISTAYLVDPSERTVDALCPRCGANLIEFDIPFAGHTVVGCDCPACMARRAGEAPDPLEGIERRMAEAGVPREHAGIEAAQGWTEALRAGHAPYIHGRCRDKSLMAYRFVRAWLEDGGSARVVTEFDLYTAKTETVTQLYTIGLLVLDGLGVNRNPGDWGLAKLGAVIDVRSRAARPTIIASELMPSELAVRLGGYDSGIGWTLEAAMERAEVVEA